MELVEISDTYTDYMKSFFGSVMMDSKKLYRTHTRKYLGIIFEIHGLKYFAPLSSPKKADYSADGTIRKSSVIVIRMEYSGVLLGSIKLNNMLPVPETEITKYDVKDETDEQYKNLVLNELSWIEKHTDMILRSAKNLYNIKTNEKAGNTNQRFYNSIMPFLEAEQKCKEFIENTLL